jgi:hypothetical protein
MTDKNAKTSQVLSNYVAVTALDEPDQFGIILPWYHGRLRTPGGHLVQSDNYKLMLHMVRELEEYPVLTVEDGIITEPRPLSAYLIFSTQRDFVGPDEQVGRDHVEHVLEHDPILNPSAGPEWTDQLRAWQPVDAFLNSLGAELHPRVKYEDEGWNNLVDALWTRWNKLSAPGKAVVLNLHPLTEGHLVATLALASRACTEIEYAHAVLAASLLHHTFGFPSEEMSPEEQHSTAFRAYRDLARVSTDYLSFFPTDSVALIVEAGESSRVEFKSTLRWDLRQQKKNDAITHGSLKTVAAFLNTGGGTLLIGVADDGTAVGIESDEFPSEDRFLLHLYGVIKAAMGVDVTPLVQADIDMFRGKKVCVVRCKTSPRPVYLKQSGKDEEFFIRMGPSSERLGPSDLVKYISENFKGR